MNWKVFRYFDLTSSVGGIPASDTFRGRARGTFSWLPQYLALIAGIVVQPYLSRYMTDAVWTFKGLPGWFFASIFVGLIAFPAVYKNSLDPEKPVFVQLCVIFATGMGWQTLVGAALKR
jgi:hypothetical protein